MLYKINTNLNQFIEDSFKLVLLLHISLIYTYIITSHRVMKSNWPIINYQFEN